VSKSHDILLNGFGLCLIVFFCIMASAQASDVEKGAVKQTDLCSPKSMTICGIPFALQPSSLGSVLTLHLPDRFVRQTVMVQCASHRNGFYYVLVNDSQQLCEQRTCKAASVMVCDTPLPVTQEMQIGKTAQIIVPQSLLAESKKRIASSFEVKCTMQNGSPQLAVVNTIGLSCNDFPCEPATLRICNDSVHVEPTSELGRVLQLVTQNKYPVTVQCVASGGQRPVYKVVDSSRVMCE